MSDIASGSSRCQGGHRHAGQIAVAVLFALVGCTGKLDGGRLDAESGSRPDAPRLFPDGPHVPPDGAPPPLDGPAPPPPDEGPPPPPPPPCTGTHPASQTYVTGTQVIAIPSVSPPAKCKVISDPVFHTRVSRVTHRSQDGYSDDGILNHYSKADYENSDGTRLLLRTTSGTWHLYDVTHFKRIKALGLGSSAQPEPRWDAKDPALLYYVDGMKLMSLDVTTMQKKTIHDFSGDVSGGYIGTRVEGDASVSRDRWCFAAFTSGDSLTAFVAYDRPSDKVLGKMTSISDTIDWISTSMSGKHCVVGWDGAPAEAFPVSFGSGVSMPSGADGHADLGLTAGGKDVLVFQDNDNDHIAMADLDTGAKTNLVYIPFTVNSDIGLHFSGNCSTPPGWVLVSTYGKKNPSGSHSWMDHHLFMVELKASPRIWRVASTYSYMGGYWSEAFASVNTAGTRVYWGSNWGQGNLDRIETFVALLPTGWSSQVP